MKATLKRALSLLLALCLMVSMAEGLLAFAASRKPSEVTSDDLLFIVPEAIYLYPNASSWKDTTTTAFQYYINNNHDGTTRSGKDTEGYIHYYFPEQARRR